MNSMVHCRACGKAIHAQALNCPSCGAPQGVHHERELDPSASRQGVGVLAWTALGFSLVGALVMLGSLQPKDASGLEGAATLAVIGSFLAILNLVNKKPGTTVAAVAVTLALTAIAFGGQWY